jgi:hypothetical protein
MRASLANPADIAIRFEQDWAHLKSEGIDTIVDPMIFRTAELFLAGESAHANAWTGISENLQELVQFFDLLIYQDRLPMIDYGYTFHPDEGFEVSRLYDVLNQPEQFIIGVAIETPAYEAARTEAITALENHGFVNDSLRDSIAAEMTAFDYQWRPNLGETLESLLTPDELAQRRAMTFVYGGILFGVYADRVGAGHLLPSKRARLNIAVALDAPTARFANEQALYEQLDQTVSQLPEFKQQTVKLPAIPPVLPYLLSSNPKNAFDLMQQALKLRNTDMVADLIECRRKLFADWQRGVMSSDFLRDMRRVGMRLSDHLKPSTPPELTTSMMAYILKAVPVGRLWNWVCHMSLAEHIWSFSSGCTLKRNREHMSVTSTDLLSTACWGYGKQRRASSCPAA